MDVLGEIKAENLIAQCAGVLGNLVTNLCAYIFMRKAKAFSNPIKHDWKWTMTSSSNDPEALHRFCARMKKYKVVIQKSKNLHKTKEETVRELKFINFWEDKKFFVYQHRKKIITNYRNVTCRKQKRASSGFLTALKVEQKPFDLTEWLIVVLAFRGNSNDPERFFIIKTLCTGHHCK